MRLRQLLFKPIAVSYLMGVPFPEFTKECESSLRVMTVLNELGDQALLTLDKSHSSVNRPLRFPEASNE